MIGDHRENKGFKENEESKGNKVQWVPKEIGDPKENKEYEENKDPKEILVNKESKENKVREVCRGFKEIGAHKALSEIEVYRV